MTVVHINDWDLIAGNSGRRFMALMNHPHKKREPFPGQGERRTEICLQAKLRRCNDVMIIITLTIM